MIIKKLFILGYIMLNTFSYADVCTKNFLPMSFDSVLVIIPFCESQTISPVGTYYGNFAITIKTYKETDNLNLIIQNTFGPNYRVADWEDLKKFYYKNNGNLLNLFNKLNLKEYTASAYVTRNGERIWDNDRYYFVSRHEHDKPSHYLDHSDIDNNLISLGSWFDLKKQIMAVKKSF